MEKQAHDESVDCQGTNGELTKYDGCLSIEVEEELTNESDIDEVGKISSY